MGTARLRWPYVLQQPSPDVSATRGGGPEVNKFEQVSSDGHQMPQGQGQGIPVQWGPMSSRRAEPRGGGGAVEWGPMHHG